MSRDTGSRVAAMVKYQTPLRWRGAPMRWKSAEGIRKTGSERKIGLSKDGWSDRSVLHGTCTFLDT